MRAGAAGYIVKNAASQDLLAPSTRCAAAPPTCRPPSPSRSSTPIARPGDAAPSGVAALTDREREVLQLIAEGLSSKEIAGMLGVSLKTVDSHRSNLMEKLDIHKVSGLVRFAIRAGLVEP